jgi:hypothetical protein
MQAEIPMEAWQILAQVGGAPAVLALIGWLFWKNAIKVELERQGTQLHAELKHVRESVEKDLGLMSATIREVQKMVGVDRLEVRDEQRNHREDLVRAKERLQRLEILAEQCLLEKRGRARRLVHSPEDPVND